MVVGVTVPVPDGGVLVSVVVRIGVPVPGDGVKVFVGNWIERVPVPVGVPVAEVGVDVNGVSVPFVGVGTKGV